MDNDTIFKGAYLVGAIGSIVALVQEIRVARQERRRQDARAIKAYMIYQAELPLLAHRMIAREIGQSSDYVKGYDQDALERYFRKFPKQRQELNHRLDTYKTFLRNGGNITDVEEKVPPAFQREDVLRDILLNTNPLGVDDGLSDNTN